MVIRFPTEKTRPPAPCAPATLYEIDALRLKETAEAVEQLEQIMERVRAEVTIREPKG